MSDSILLFSNQRLFFWRILFWKGRNSIVIKFVTCLSSQDSCSPFSMLADKIFFNILTAFVAVSPWNFISVLILFLFLQSFLSHFFPQWKPCLFFLSQAARIIAKLAAWGRDLMEGSDLNYYFNWIKSQLSSQVCLFLDGNKPQISVLLCHLLNFFLFFALVCKMCPINCPPTLSSHSTNKHRIGITAYSLHSSAFITSMNERAPFLSFFFFCCCLSLIRTYTVQVQKQA